MADVGVRAGAKKYVWSFPGDDAALVKAFRGGAFPFHVHPDWKGPPATCAGQVRETDKTPFLDRLVEIRCDTPRGGPQVVRAKLLTLDDEVSWKGPKEGAAPVAAASAGGSGERSVVEMSEEWGDAKALWDFVRPVFLAWTTDLAALAGKLKKPAVADEVAAIAAGWTAGGDAHEQADAAFKAIGKAVGALATAAKKSPTAAGMLSGQKDQLRVLREACFGDDDLADDAPDAVAGWVEGVVPLAGMLRAWRGDGTDGPAWDEPTAEKIRALHRATAAKFEIGADED